MSASDASLLALAVCGAGGLIAAGLHIAARVLRDPLDRIARALTPEEPKE